MKVLDPQAALLTTVEVQQFFSANRARPADKKIGAYGSVNLHNYFTVKQDMETYFRSSAPYVLKQPRSDTWMKDLIVKLRKFHLTKTEVFSLINLGVGINEPAALVSATDEDGAQAEKNGEDGDSEAGAEEAEENSLDRMLFGLVVEESDERFAGDEGEERITEILGILRVTMGPVKETNGTAVNGD